MQNNLVINDAVRRKRWNCRVQNDDTSISLWGSRCVQESSFSNNSQISNSSSLRLRNPASRCFSATLRWIRSIGHLLSDSDKIWIYWIFNSSYYPSNASYSRGITTRLSLKADHGSRCATHHKETIIRKLFISFLVISCTSWSYHSLSVHQLMSILGIDSGKPYLYWSSTDPP